MFATDQVEDRVFGGPGGHGSGAGSRRRWRGSRRRSDRTPTSIEATSASVRIVSAVGFLAERAIAFEIVHAADHLAPDAAMPSSSPSAWRRRLSGECGLGPHPDPDHAGRGDDPFQRQVSNQSSSRSPTDMVKIRIRSLTSRRLIPATARLPGSARRCPGDFEPSAGGS